MGWTLIPRFLNGLLMVGMPVVLGLWLWRRYPERATWRIWGIGVAAMLLAQVGHFPFNWLLTALFRNTAISSWPHVWTIIFNGVVLGLSAGLWEECFRYIAYRWMAKDARSWGAGLMLGAGHGGVEAILLGVYVIYFLFQMIALQSVDLAQVVPAQQLAAAQQQVAAFWATPWYLTMMGALERVFALLFHLTASVMVLQVFLRRQLRWLGLAIVLHALLDAIAVIASGLGNIFIVEGLVAVFSLFTLGILWYLRRLTPDAPPEAAAPAIPPGPPVESPDDLEGSRYQ